MIEFLGILSGTILFFQLCGWYDAFYTFRSCNKN